MKGVVKYQRGSGYVELRDVEEERDLEPCQVRIEVKSSGICGSDLHIFHDTINYNIRTPVIIGHEFSGVVVEKGVEVGDDVSVGDRVTGEPSIHICGKCIYCLSEHYNLCSERRVMGYYYNGSFARYVNARFIHKLPENVSFKAGAITELLACCVHSVIEQAGVSAGDFVAVVGPGPVGLLSALVAKAEGGTVMICGTSKDRDRLRFAEELGIDYIVDVDRVDGASRARELTSGYGADVVIEGAGVSSAIDMALDMVRKRGKVSQMGLPGVAVQIDFEKVAYKELQVSGGIGQRRPAWERSLKLMEQGKIDCEKLISHELPLSEWNRGFDMMEKQEGIKLVLNP